MDRIIMGPPDGRIVVGLACRRCMPTAIRTDHDSISAGRNPGLCGYCRTAQHNDAPAAEPADQVALRIGVLRVVAADLVVMALGDQQSLRRFSASNEAGSEQRQAFDDGGSVAAGRRAKYGG